MLLRLLLLSCLFFSMGCYTQLSMFQPEIEDEFYSYSAAPIRPNLTLYANNTSNSLSYSIMNSYFSNRYNYYDSYYLSGYRMYVPIYDPRSRTWNVWFSSKSIKTPRSFSTDRNNNTTNTTNLNVTRTRTNNRVSDPYPVQDTPRQDTFNSQRPSNSSGGTRATRRN